MPEKSMLSAQPPARQPLPKAVAIAAVLFAISAALRLVPLDALMVALPLPTAAPMIGPSWYFVPAYPGMPLVLPLQLGLLFFFLRGHAWSRYAVAALVAYLLAMHFSDAYGPKLGSFMTGAWLIHGMQALQVATVVLLFLPSARAHFGSRKHRSVG